MNKKALILVFCLFSLGLFSLFLTRCGSQSGTIGNDSSANVNLIIQNPDPNSSGTAKAISDSDLSLSKAVVTKASLNSGILTITGSDMEAITHNFSVEANAATITTSLTVPAGKDRTFGLNLDDTTETTNGITVGYTLSGTKVDIADGPNSITLKPSFKNLATDEKEGVHFIRFNQENKTQTKLTIGFGSALTDAQKINLRCIIELDTSGTRSSLCDIDANQSSGLTTGTKCALYFLFRGGTNRPSGFLYNSSDTKTMKLNASWSTTSSGNTMLIATFGIRQTKSSMDANEEGQWAGACSLTGSNPYDLIPNKGYAKYVLSGNNTTDLEQDVESLISEGASCSTGRSGETCEKGDCAGSGVCVALSSVSLTNVVSNFAGPGVGDQTAGSTDGVGSVARFRRPFGLCMKPDGSKIFVAQFSPIDSTIREITVASLNVTTLAGSAGTNGTDDGVGSAARFSAPAGCVVGPDGETLYVTDYLNSTIRKIVISTATVSTLAGLAGSSGSDDGIGSQARFFGPRGIAIDGEGKNAYITDYQNHTVRKMVISTQEVTTLAGSAGSSATTDGVGNSARFTGPAAIAIDSTDTNLYVAEDGSKVRKIVIFSKEVTSIAGSGTCSSVDGTGALASFCLTQGITIDPTDTTLYVVERTGSRVRKVDLATLVVSTIAGSDTRGDTNGTGTNATFDSPIGIITDRTGKTLYLVEFSNNKIRQIQ